MTYEIKQGDCLDVLKTLESESVQMCVTSPPYFGLRDYGTAKWEGGDAECDHQPSSTPGERGIASSTLGGGKNHTGHKQEGFKSQCKCGAVRIDAQIGLEATPALFVAKMVEVFEEVRRVLKPDGTCWVNLGDSYNANQGAGFNAHSRTRPHLSGEGIGQKRIDEANRNTIRKNLPGIKPKDLLGIPWRVAFALQEAGWWLRQDIIWSKPNPMPESVTDRCTKAHEYLFLLTKSQKYYYDNEAIKEPASENTHARLSQDLEQQIGSFRANGGSRADRPMKAVGGKSRDRTMGNRNGEGASTLDRRKVALPGSGIKNNTSFNEAVVLRVENRNKRSVWTVATQPYSEAHFATFPPKLIEPCILAGSREGISC